MLITEYTDKELNNNEKKQLFIQLLEEQVNIEDLNYLTLVFQTDYKKDIIEYINRLNKKQYSLSNRRQINILFKHTRYLLDKNIYSNKTILLSKIYNYLINHKRNSKLSDELKKLIITNYIDELINKVSFTHISLNVTLRKLISMEFQIEYPSKLVDLLENNFSIKLLRILSKCIGVSYESDIKEFLNVIYNIFLGNEKLEISNNLIKKYYKELYRDIKFYNKSIFIRLISPKEYLLLEHLHNSIFSILHTEIN